jgi:hypothetical protein
MEMKRNYQMFKWIHGYEFDGDLLVKKKKTKAVAIHWKELNKKFNLTTSSTNLDRRKMAGGYLWAENVDLKDYDLMNGTDDFWKLYLMILNPFFDAQIPHDQLLETLDETSPLYNEYVKNGIMGGIITLAETIAFDVDIEVWTDDIGIRLEPTVQNLAMEAYMLYLGIVLSSQEMLDDEVYASKVNQSSYSLILEPTGYEVHVNGFWDTIWRGFSLDPKRGNAKLCKRCSKPFVGKTMKKIHCSDKCKYGEWTDRKKAEKLGEKR